MHAILVDENKALVWSEVPDPVLKNHEVLIEVHAAT
jgi:NADPH2:quinone reductase